MGGRDFGMSGARETRCNRPTPVRVLGRMHDAAFRASSSLSRLIVLIATSVPLLVQAAGERERVHEQTYAVKPGGDLRVHAARGSVRVEGSDSLGEVRMKVQARAVRGSASRAAELLAAHEVAFRQTDGVVELETRLPREANWMLWGPDLVVEITIQTPREFNVEATTSGGSMELSRLKGQVEVRTSGGSLRFNDLEGTLKGRTSGGSIKAAQIRGRVELQTSGGAVNVEDAKGGEVLLSTSGGSINANGLDGPAVLRTSGGAIRVRTRGKALEAATSGGSIDATLEVNPTDPVVLRTSGGGISVTLPESAAVTLDAATSGGSVRNEFAAPQPAEKHRNVLRGPIGNGGPDLKLRTSGGGIQIRKN